MKIKNGLYNIYFSNPRVPCKSGIIPSIDFTKWAEYPQAAYAQHYANDYSGQFDQFVKKK